MHTKRLNELRTIMQEREIGVYLVPMGDRFQSEFVPESDRRLEWLTGFTGSAGFAIILQERAVFFTDGRYILQAKQELDTALYDIVDMTVQTPKEWLIENAAMQKIFYDAWLFSRAIIASYEKAGLSLIPQENLIDHAWADQPVPALKEAFWWEECYSGKTFAAKQQELQQWLSEKAVDALWLGLPEQVGWLLNMRGYDLPCTPFVLSFACLEHDKLTVYLDVRKVPSTLPESWQDVRFVDIAQIEQDMARLSGKILAVELSQLPAQLYVALQQSNVELKASIQPVTLLKACKNTVEVEGMRQAHIRDGVAVTECLYWLDTQMEQGERVTECDVADKLIECRQQQPLYHSTSFDTIAGYGPNGAIIHYRAREESCLTLAAKGLLLVDSGGQYLDGTTDVTRTIALGEVSAAQKLHYTLVLKGHIALAEAVFPVGTSGKTLDILARQPLWNYGLDYHHGTGHGVGAFMNVHEGPQGISKRGSEVALEPGMVLSNEPGCYIEGDHGIRIENLVVVEKSTGPSPMHMEFLRFDTITLVPIDPQPIMWELLTQSEVDWLKRYHRHVRDALFSALSPKIQSWVYQRYLDAFGV